MDAHIFWNRTRTLGAIAITAVLVAAGAVAFTVMGGSGAASATPEAAADAPGARAAAGSSIPLPPANEGFSYQLGGPYAPENGATVVSRDRTQSPLGGSHYDICYVNVFQTQPDEPGQSTTNPPYGTTSWWDANHPALLLRDVNDDLVMDDVWGEATFDVRTATKRAQLFAIQSDWFDGCAADGFDAVEPDNLDVYDRSDGLISFPQSKEYMKTVVPYVHALDLAIAQKNTSDEVDGYGMDGKDFVDTVSPAQGFDFAIAEECGVWEECDAYSDLYGDLVFEIEYIGDKDPDAPKSGTDAFADMCAAHGSTRSIILRDMGVAPVGATEYYHDEC